MSKTDLMLGYQVREYLQKTGIETPFDNNSSYSSKMDVISESFEKIMKSLGLDLNDDSLRDTPLRVAKMFTYEIFSGLNYENFPKSTVIENSMNYDEMVIELGIKVSSTCEHHFLPIDGFAKIAYIPNNLVLGLSKLNRVVEFFSKRPQVQERLTAQIQEALKFMLQTEDVAVEISAVHHCVKSRGIEHENCYTVTRKLSGSFKEDSSTRNEFLNTK